MSQKLVIHLTEETTAEYLAYASDRTEAEVNAGCEPSGSTISIAIGPGSFGCIAYAESGRNHIDLGEVKIELVDA
jgi:hypothetical protein